MPPYDRMIDEFMLPDDEFISVEEYPHLAALLSDADQLSAGDTRAADRAANPRAANPFYRLPEDRPPEELAPPRNLTDEIALRDLRRRHSDMIDKYDRAIKSERSPTRRKTLEALRQCTEAQIWELDERLRPTDTHVARAEDDYDAQIEARAQELLKSDAELVELARADSFKAYLSALERAERDLFSPTSSEADA